MAGVRMECAYRICRFHLIGDSVVKNPSLLCMEVVLFMPSIHSGNSEESTGGTCKRTTSRLVSALPLTGYDARLARVVPSATCSACSSITWRVRGSAQPPQRDLLGPYRRTRSLEGLLLASNCFSPWVFNTCLLILALQQGLHGRDVLSSLLHGFHTLPELGLGFHSHLLVLDLLVQNPCRVYSHDADRRVRLLVLLCPRATGNVDNETSVRGRLMREAAEPPVVLRSRLIDRATEFECLSDLSATQNVIKKWQIERHDG